MAAQDGQDAKGRRTRGTAWVVAQFALIAVLAAAALPALRHGTAPRGAWVLWALAVLVGSWALLANRPGNFNIRPTPRAGGQLVQHGPYRWIRHPMYTSVGCFAAGCAVAAGSAPVWAVALLLAAVLAGKSRLEERWMCDTHRSYADYRRRTWRFIPWLL